MLGTAMEGQRLDNPHPLPGPSALDRLEARLRFRLIGRIRGLRLVAAGPGVILTGYARTYYAKQLAQEAVMAATDLPVLANEIEVA
jgi:hypothetical protein